MEARADPLPNPLTCHGVQHPQPVCREGPPQASTAQRGGRGVRSPRQAASPLHRRGHWEGDRRSLGSADGQGGGISRGVRSPGIPSRNARQKAQVALFFSLSQAFPDTGTCLIAQVVQNGKHNGEEAIDDFGGNPCWRKPELPHGRTARPLLVQDWQLPFPRRPCPVLRILGSTGEARHPHRDPAGIGPAGPAKGIVARSRKKIPITNWTE